MDELCDGLWLCLGSLLCDEKVHWVDKKFLKYGIACAGEAVKREGYYIGKILCDEEIAMRWQGDALRRVKFLIVMN